MKKKFLHLIFSPEFIWSFNSEVPAITINAPVFDLAIETQASTKLSICILVNGFHFSRSK